MHNFLITFCALYFLTTTSSLADVLQVPDDHPTIQEAIEAAQEGDEILVGPGVWYENLYVNKQLTITTLSMREEQKASACSGLPAGMNVV